MAAKKTCLVKLKKEMRSFMKEPPPYIPAVAINESDILEWHFLIEGPAGTPYEGGWYIGKLKFPTDYPFKPPAIMMLTPSGRFKTGTRLCLSMSDFHPETWNPMWSVASVLTGLLSFMLESTATTGSMESTVEEKRQIAAESGQKLLQNAHYRSLFPELPNLIDRQKQGGREKAELGEETEQEGGLGEASDTSSRLEEGHREADTEQIRGVEELIAVEVQTSSSESAVGQEGEGEGQGGGEGGGEGEEEEGSRREQTGAASIEEEVFEEARQSFEEEGGKLEEASTSTSTSTSISISRGSPLTEIGPNPEAGGFSESSAEATVRRLEDLLAHCHVALQQDTPEKRGFERGVCLLRCGEVEEATRAFMGGLAGVGGSSFSSWKDLVKGVDSVKAIVLEANALLEDSNEGDPASVLALLAPILQYTSPKAPHFLMVKASALLRMGDLEMSISVLEAALELASSDALSTPLPELNSSVFRPISSQEVLNVLARTRTALRHRSRGNDHFRKKSYSMAVKAYDNALAAEERCASLHCSRATALAAMQRHEEALAACKRALELFNGHAKARRRQAESLAALGRHTEAAAEFQKLLISFPEDRKLLELAERQQKLAAS